MRCALIHGFAGDPASWDAVRAAWPRADELVPLALPGHGGGDVRDSWAANLAAIAPAVASADVVIGYSLGARVALGLLASGACARAVLISVHPGLTTDDERAARRASDAAWADLLRARGIAAFADAWEAQPLFATQAHRAPPAALAARRARRLTLSPAALAQSLSHLGLAAMPDYRAALTAAAARVALVVGADDAKFVALAHSTGLPITVIPESGHDPTLEQPVALARVLSRVV